MSSSSDENASAWASGDVETSIGIASQAADLASTALTDDDSVKESQSIYAETDSDSVQSNHRSGVAKDYGSFLGKPVSKGQWRHKTVGERLIATGLEQLRSSDLAVHLYGAFNVKRAAALYKQACVLGSIDDTEAQADLDWVPPKTWVAWPLPPDVVPREHDRNKWEDRAPLPAPYLEKPSKAGQELRFLLEAQIQRTAKQRFTDRESDDPEEDISSSTSSQNSSSDTGESETSSERHSKIRVQHRRDDRARASEPLIPMVSADDEMATQILRPCVQHLLGQLDTLLMALHHARASYLIRKSDKPNTTKATRDLSASKTKSERKQHDITMSNDSSQSSSQASSPPASPDPAMKVKRQASFTSHAYGSHARRKRKLGLRDWSDVLGTSALVGIEPAVIRRTAMRCTGVFNEDMKFRTLSAGAKEGEEASSFTAKDATPEDMKYEALGHDSETLHGGVHIDGFLQPISRKRSWIHPKKSARKPKVAEPE